MVDFWPDIGYCLVEMKYNITFAPEAREDFKNLSAYHRAAVRDIINQCLKYEPTRVSRSRIKRLRDTNKPQYRLRVDDIGVFYDVNDDEVEILAIVDKTNAADWLRKEGV